jgi:hypothetical protein
VDGAGRVAVADETSGSLWLFDPVGSLLGATAGLGHPRALSFGRDSILYVAQVQPGGVRTIRLGGIRSRDKP